MLGGVVPWWLLTRTNSLVVVTGPSQTVLGSVTWKEIRRATEDSKFPLGLTVSQGIRASPLRVTVRQDWGALGYSTTSVERASGQHNRKLLVIGEEASGIPDEIYDAIDSLKFVRLLLIGNPIRSAGRFVELIHQAERDKRDHVPRNRAVNAIRISSRESPHAHLEESPWGLADKTFIEDVERRHGKTSLYVKVHIDAEIPTVDAETLLPLQWLDWAASQPRRVYPAGHPIHATRRISCDLGEGVGRDSSCILVRDDLGILDVVWGKTLGLPEAAEWIAKLKRQACTTCLTSESATTGWELVATSRLTLLPAESSTPSAMPARALRDQLTLSISEARPRGSCATGSITSTSPITDTPNDTSPSSASRGPWWDRMRDELKVLTYSLVGRQTALMTKEDWCTTVGHSPDLGDALIQSFAFA